jgi:hypothetical protein
MASPAAPLFAPIGSSNGIGGNDSVVSSQVGDSVVTGTGDPGSTVTLSFGANSLTPGIAVTDGNGNWSYALSADDITAIGQGTDKVITAIVTADGTSSGSAPSASFSLDTLAPFIAIDPIGGSDSVVSNQPGDNLVTGVGVVGYPANTITLLFGDTVLGTLASASDSGTKGDNITNAAHHQRHRQEWRQRHTPRRQHPNRHRPGDGRQLVDYRANRTDPRRQHDSPDADRYDR